MNYKNYDINAPEFDSKIKYYFSLFFISCTTEVTLSVQADNSDRYETDCIRIWFHTFFYSYLSYCSIQSAG